MNKSTITNEATGVISGNNLDLGTFATWGAFEGVTFDNQGVITGSTITLMGGTVHNSGTITAKQDFTGFYYYPQTQNDSNLRHYLINETGGSIIANKLALETTSTLENKIGATITVDVQAKFSANVKVQNNGYINIGTLVNNTQIVNEQSGTIVINNSNFRAGGITNSGTVEIKSIANIADNPTIKFTNNASSTIKIVNMVQSSRLAIENQSSVLLPAYIEIGSYEGKGKSELVLTLPDNNIQSPLLKVINDASFSQHSKIILAGKLKASASATQVDILDASTIHGTVTDLLYSQVYKNTPKPSNPTTQLASGSIFINIATATLKTVHNRDILTAVVEFINPLSSKHLTATNITVTKSLLGYDILKKTNILNATRTVLAPKVPKIPKHLQHIDTSGIEYSQVVNNHLDISSSLIDSTSIIAPANQQSFNLRNLNYNILGALGYYSGSDNHEKFKHSWKQTLLHIGGESALDKTKFGLSFAYLGCDMSQSAPNKPNTKSNSYLTIVHAITNISPWSFSTGLIFGTTKYNDPNTKNKSIGEVSAIVSSRYEVTVSKFNINLGLNSALTHVSMSKHKNNNNLIDANKKLFLCLGASAGAARSYNIQNNITTEINGGYSYTQGIQNENNIIVPSSGSYKLPQNELAKHNLKINIKNYCYYKKVYYSLSFNCNYNSSSTLFGGNFAASYKF